MRRSSEEKCVCELFELLDCQEASTDPPNKNLVGRTLGTLTLNFQSVVFTGSALGIYLQEKRHA